MMAPLSCAGALLLALALCAVRPAHGSAGGARGTACSGGVPGGSAVNHGTLMAGNGGFSLNFSPPLGAGNTYTPGKEYQVTLSGSSFSGFLITATTPDLFDIAANGKPGPCNSPTMDSLTHTSPAAKTSVAFTVTPTYESIDIRTTILTSFGGNYFIWTMAIKPAQLALHASMAVEQSETFNGRCDTAIGLTYGTPNVIAGSQTTNRGDYTVYFGQRRQWASNTADGVLIPNVVGHSVDHGQGQGVQLGTAGAAKGSSNYFIALTVLTGSEYNQDVSFGFFPFAAGWLGGVRYSSSSYVSTTVPVSQVTQAATGQYVVDLLPNGVDSRMNNGVLIVAGAKNEDNYALSQPQTDGTFRVFLKDNGANAAIYESDPIAFVYVPDNLPTTVVGRVAGDATKLVGAGYTATVSGAATITLTIPHARAEEGGESERTGTLIVSPEGGASLNLDNIITAEPIRDGLGNDYTQGWTIKTYDLPGGTLQDVGGEPMFSFAFMRFDDACTGGPCQNGGTCLQGLADPLDTLTDGTHSTFTCMCPTGFDGKLCELTAVDVCTPTTCNGGKCTELPGSAFSCACLPGLGGPACASDCTVLTFPTGVEYGNVLVQQISGGSASSEISLSLSGNTLGFQICDGPGCFLSNRGDYTINVDPTKGVLIASVANSLRDHRNGQLAQLSFVSTAVYSTYSLSLHDTDNCESNADITAAFFPISEGWMAGHALNSANNGPITRFSAVNPSIRLGTEFVDNTDGTYDLKLPGVNGNTDGVLLVSHGKNEQNFAQTSVLANGDFRIHVRDAQGGYEAEPVAFVYVPKARPGMVSGRVMGDATVMASATTADFTVTKVGFGTYLLTILDCGGDGTLLVTPEAGGTANTLNLVAFEPLGNGKYEVTTFGVLPLGEDQLHDVGTEAAFSFVFIRKEPEVPREVLHASMAVEQSATGGGRCDTAVGLMYSTPGVVAGTQVANKADYNVYFRSQAMWNNNANDGILIPCVSGHTIDHGQGQGVQLGVATAATTASKYFISLHLAGSGSEYNQAVNFGYFPFSAGWLGGARYSSSSYVSTTVPVSQVTQAATGQYVVDLLPNGVNSRNNDGVLIVAGAKNEDNYALSRPQTDGTFRVFLKDTGANAALYESDPIAFVYVPDNIPNVVVGRVSGNATKLVGAGYTATVSGAATITLTIPHARAEEGGESERTGTLIVSPEGGASLNLDNIITAEPIRDGLGNGYTQGWTIKTYDLPGGTLQDVGGEPMFSFAFMRFDDACTGGPCQNGGTCLQGLADPLDTLTDGTHSTFTCMCPTGFDGKLCELTAVDVCTATTCPNSGLCIEGPGSSFECECATGLGGPACGTDCTVLTFPTGVEYGNVLVQQISGGSASSEISLSLSGNTLGFQICDGPGCFLSNRGDYTINVDPTKGVLIASVANSLRDHRNGQLAQLSFVSTAVYSTYSLSLHDTDNCESNADITAAFFPISEGWMAGHALNSANNGPITRFSAVNPSIRLGTEFVDNTDGTYDLKLPGVNGNTDGVLLVSHGKNEQNFAQTSVLANGDFRIHVRDAQGGYEAEPVAFVYVPKARPGMVSGRVMGDATVMASATTADFTVTKVGFGTYLLTILDCGGDGTLLVTPEAGGTANTLNLVAFEPLGNGKYEVTTFGVLPLGEDQLHDVGTEAAFSFVFIRKEPAQPRKVFHADIDVVQSATGNSRCDTALAFRHGGLGVAIGQTTSNRGDYTVLFGEADEWVNNTKDGVLIPIVVGHGEDHGQGQGVQLGTASASRGTNNYFISLHLFGSGSEYNQDIALGYFPFSEGWLGGISYSSTEFVSTTVSASQFSQAATGQYVVDLLPNGVDSRMMNGVMMAAGAKNEDNYALVQAQADGTFKLFLHDNGANGASYESDPIAFVYVPDDLPNAIVGRVAGDGTILLGSGFVAVRTPGTTNEVTLTIGGQSPESGTLLVTPEGGASSNVDNFVSVEGGLQSWTIRSYDLPTGAPQDVAAEPMFSFAFFPYDSPCSSLPCQNGATCTTDGRVPMCACSPGWTGDLCDVADVDVCGTNPCPPGSACREGPLSSYTCACPLGMAGLSCTTECAAVMQPTGVEFGLVTVTQLASTNNEGVDVNLTLAINSSGFRLCTAETGCSFTQNRGDYHVDLDPAMGVMITSVASAARDHGQGQLEQLGFASSAIYTEYAISLHDTDDCEVNIDVAAAFFPISEGWMAGHALNSANNGPITRFSAVNPSIRLGTEFVDNTDGTYDLKLPGVNGNTDGVLLVSHGKNEQNFAQTSVLANGDFRIHVRDAQGGYEAEPVAFVYVPKARPGMVSGRVMGDGTPSAASTGFSVFKAGTGEYDITLDCLDNGVLLVSPETGGTLNEKNFVTYAPLGPGRYRVMTYMIVRDAMEILHDVGAEAAFSFVFIRAAPVLAGQPEHGQLRTLQTGTGNGGCDIAIELEYSTPGVTLGLTTSNRGDYTTYFGARDEWTTNTANGLVMVTISDHGRDHQQGQGIQRGTASASRGGNGNFFLSLHEAGSGSEHNQDLSFGFFKFAEWIAGVGYNSGNGGLLTEFLSSSVAPSQFTRVRSGEFALDLMPNGIHSQTSPGVLLVSSAKNEDNYALVRAMDDGTFMIFSRDNGNGNSYEQDPVGFVYVEGNPITTVVGRVAGDGTILAGSGFTATRTAVGDITIVIPGQSAATGTFLASPEGGRSLNLDNIITVEADATSWSVRIYDLPAAVPEDVGSEPAFSFAFFKYTDACQASPCMNGGTCKQHGSEYRCMCAGEYGGNKCEIAPQTVCPSMPCKNGGLCAEGVGASFECTCPGTLGDPICTTECTALRPSRTVDMGFLSVTQNDIANNPTSVDLQVSLATSNFQLCTLTSGCSGTQNRGDYHVKFDTAAGVLLTSVAQRSVFHGQGRLRQFPMSSTSIGSASDYFISLHEFNRCEVNADVGAVYFPFDQGWFAAHVINSVNNGPVTTFAAASANITLGAQFVENGNATYDVKVPNVNAQEDGVLLASHGKNEANFGQTSVLSQDTFRLTIRDALGTPEREPIVFVFVPKMHPGAVVGRVMGDGSVEAATPNAFSVQHVGIGTYDLHINCSEAGVLIITGETGDMTSERNHALYEVLRRGVFRVFTQAILADTEPELHNVAPTAAAFSFGFFFLPEPCGNGALDAGEECDDSNKMSGDGCSETCKLEPGYDCSPVGVECSLCGDGLITGPEVCDAGDSLTAGCPTCEAVTFGFVCVAAGDCQAAEQIVVQADLQADGLTVTEACSETFLAAYEAVALTFIDPATREFTDFRIQSVNGIQCPAVSAEPATTVEVDVFTPAVNASGVVDALTLQGDDSEAFATALQAQGGSLASLASFSQAASVATVAPTEATARSSSSDDNTPIIVGAVLGSLVLLALIAVVVVLMRGGKKVDYASGDRTTVAFENPAYDNPGFTEPAAVVEGDGEGLYDDVAMTKQNPIYTGEPLEPIAPGEAEAGYLDVAPNLDD